MAYCRKCGAEIDDEAVICPKCGVMQNGSIQNFNQNKGTVDDGSMTWFWIGFICPLAGLILYLVWRSSKPQNAKKANMGSIIGFIICYIAFVLVSSM